MTTTSRFAPVPEQEYPTLARVCAILGITPSTLGARDINDLANLIMDDRRVEEFAPKLWCRQHALPERERRHFMERRAWRVEAAGDLGHEALGHAEHADGLVRFAVMAAIQEARGRMTQRWA